MKYPVVTLCGSTRFKEDFERVNRDLTLLGNIVISVGAFGHAGDTFTEEQKVMLDDIHKQKIDMADAIYVINRDGYIGESTKSEIKYAYEHNKKVIYMETCGQCSHYLGGGDWNLCCDLKHEGYPCGFLCYKYTPACDKYNARVANR